MRKLHVAPVVDATETSTKPNTGPKSTPAMPVSAQADRQATVTPMYTTMNTTGAHGPVPSIQPWARSSTPWSGPPNLV